jgi:TRAP-type C4-dicarboxylate transport system permease small subunit
MKRTLDRLYGGAAWLAALFMIGTLSMILLSVFGRLFHFHVRGTDAYAGYCMAAAAFLALAHTLKRGEHIRVTLLLDRLGPRGNRWLELWCHGLGTLLAGLLAWFAGRLVMQSFQFHDISQGNDATPLWIPQLGMAIGALVFLIALLEDFFAVLKGGKLRHRDPDAEPVRSE